MGAKKEKEGKVVVGGNPPSNWWWYLGVIAVLYGMGTVMLLKTSFPFLTTVFSFISAKYCYRMAYKHGKNLRWGFVVGAAFGLAGLAAYWVYCRLSKKGKVDGALD